MPTKGILKNAYKICVPSHCWWCLNLLKIASNSFITSHCSFHCWRDDVYNLNIAVIVVIVNEWIRGLTLTLLQHDGICWSDFIFILNCLCSIWKCRDLMLQIASVDASTWTIYSTLTEFVCLQRMCAAVLSRIQACRCRNWNQRCAGPFCTNKVHLPLLLGCCRLLLLKTLDCSLRSIILSRVKDIVSSTDAFMTVNFQTQKISLFSQKISQIRIFRIFRKKFRKFRITNIKNFALLSL